MNWLETHIEEFVKPVAGDGFNTESFLAETHYECVHGRTFTQEELTVIKNAWRAIKKQARGRQILLPGRDVFIFEILARRENYPTVFMPECSRASVAHIAKHLPPPVRGCFLFDTGFAGSIPRNLRIKNYSLLSSAIRDDTQTQIFPRLSLSRHLALKIEQTPKYWESGRSRINDGKEEVYQPISHHKEFLSAARLTVQIYRNSAPKFINKHNPLGRNAQELYTGKW